MKTYRWIIKLFIGFLSLAVPVSAFAAWPERAITVVVPYAAGGGTDATARIIANMLKESLEVPVNVVNRPAGGAVVGQESIAGAKPDGYTIGLVSVETFLNHNMGLTERSGRDYTPLAMMNADPSALVVSADADYNDANDLLDAIRNNPGKLKSSGTGTGGAWHVAMAGMLDNMGIAPDAVRWVPSEGAGPAVLELAAGGVDFVPVSLPESRAMIDAGKAKALALMSEDRVSLYPDVPTLKEATDSDWIFAAWRGMVAPKGLPEDIAKKLSEALAEINASDEYRDFMENQGFEVIFMDHEEFAQFLVDGDADATAIMKKLNLGK